MPPTLVRFLRLARRLGQEKAFGDEGLKKLANYGYVQFFRSGEYHHNSPLLMKTLHKASPAGAAQPKLTKEKKRRGGGERRKGACAPFVRPRIIVAVGFSSTPPSRL